MKMLTKQQVFNKVSKHLLKQNEKCVDKIQGATVCRNFVKGKRCAIASLLPIKFFKTNPDKCKAPSQVISEINKFAPDFIQNQSFYGALQMIHDYNKPCRWPRKLRAFARMNGLAIPEFLKNA